jgi:hypothetical protein
VADANLARAEQESRAALASSPATSGPWDHRSAPRYFDRVDGHLHFNETEAALLRKNGFVVLDRLGGDSYVTAYHQIFQQQLPVYVGVDAILNAVFQGSQMLLEEVELKRLGPRLVVMLDRMRGALPGLRTRWGKEVADDLSVYLAVAHRLLHGDGVGKGTTGNPALDTQVAELAGRSPEAGLVEVTLFGRPRMIDYSQFTPRGHYASSGGGENLAVKGEFISLAAYFGAMMWLSRLEFNLVSRSCRSSQPTAIDASETPREARDALALADLVTASGSAADLRLFEEVYSVFAGRREDVPLPDLARLGQEAHVLPGDAAGAAQTKLAAAIGDRWKRTARTHFMPEGARELPAITTMIGTRIVPDIAPLAGLVHDRLPGREQLGFADVAYLLGHDRARASLGPDLARFPGLGAALDAGRSSLAAGARGKDVYSTWLSAVEQIAAPPPGTLPSYMTTEAFADFRMNSALAGYAQIRHTFVLLAGQGYDAYGCEIPDGWVEPAIGVWDRILAWSRAARVAVPHRQGYFQRVDAVVGMLRAISATELSGAPLTEPQRRWLGMVSEYIPTGGYGGESGAPPRWTGWYFDLFPDRHHGADRAVDFIADYFTLTSASEVRYLGVSKAATGVFVVDTGGEPRLMVGPVTRAFEAVTPIATRLDDKAAQQLPPAGRLSPWSASYLVPTGPVPSIAARLFACGSEARVIAQAPSDLGPVTITLLDHHGDPIGEPLTRPVGPALTAFAFALTPALQAARAPVEGIHVKVLDLATSGVGVGQWSESRGTSLYAGTDFDLFTGSLASGKATGSSGFPPPATPGFDPF